MDSKGISNETILTSCYSYYIISGMVFPSLETFFARQLEGGNCVSLSSYVEVQTMWFCVVLSQCVVEISASGIVYNACLFGIRVLIPLLRLMTWMRIYQRKVLLAHRPIIMIVYGYGRNSFMEHPDQREWVPTSLCKNPSIYSPKQSVPDLRDLVVI